MEQLKDIGCKWVVLGHSERRHIIGEDDQVRTTERFNYFDNESEENNRSFDMPTPVIIPRSSLVQLLKA